MIKQERGGRFCIEWSRRTPREEGKSMYSNPPPRPPGPPLFGPWHCVGVCALALGLGIFIAAVCPVGALMFLVAFLLIFCGIGCLRRF